MPELMKNYGIKIRNNMCSCPWHTDKHPSMKVFNDGANCFACGWNGDIFSFVMKMDGVDFKTAFKSLGGQYCHYNSVKERATHIASLKAKKAEYERKRKENERVTHELSEAITICRKASEIYEPLSDGWTYAVNELQWLLYLWDCRFFEDQEIDKSNVHRRYREIKRYFL